MSQTINLLFISFFFVPSSSPVMAQLLRQTNLSEFFFLFPSYASKGSVDIF